MRASTVLASVFGLAAISTATAIPSSSSLEIRWHGMTIDDAILVGSLEAYRLENGGFPRRGTQAEQHYEAAMAQCQAILGPDFETAKRNYRQRMNYHNYFPTQQDVNDANAMAHG
ncbi:hypothetical protein GGS26DRAFT_311124 [Hypomontagnella submonticulosa]|nr:hypothetical protein GGS26DRAFT_311124 [Hypomontagnella submonticulosa]